jgi:prolyl 4-hydroxylase
LRYTMRSEMRIVICLLSIILVDRRCNADLFTAMADMEALLGAEKEVTGVISQYIDSEMRRLEQLKKFSQEYSARNALAVKEGTRYLMNPVNAYLMIKRLTSDWSYVETMMKNNMADEFIANITQRRRVNEVRYPDQEDLNGAAVALLRLQDTYRLDTHDLANGIILGEAIGQQLNAHDCFEVGRAAYNARDYYHTLLWMQEAYERHEKETPPSVSISEVLEYLAFALYQQGNVKHALALTRRLAAIDPAHPRAAGNVKWYEDMVKEETGGDLQMKTDASSDENLPSIVNRRADDNGMPERDIYEALCRGEVPVSPKTTSKLYCYYKSDRDFLRLAPIKVEILHLNPLVVLFREVISDYEISIIKELATPKLRRATVQNSKTGELETASYRISKSAWLKSEEHPVIARINKRIDMMTNLNMETAEELQVANYGIGGHYDPHYDMSTRGEKDPYIDGTGNRIATVLFYVSFDRLLFYRKRKRTHSSL